MSVERDRAQEEAVALEKASPGAQRQIDEMRDRMHKALRAMVVVVVLVTGGFAVTGWQIDRAFDNLEAERVSRIGAQSSINAYFCREIDKVGDGVGDLVAISLRGSPPPDTLSPPQRAAYKEFTDYLADQRRPPRCHALALKLAVLTGADPDDVVLTPLRVKGPPPESNRNRRDGAGR